VAITPQRLAKVMAHLSIDIARYIFKKAKKFYFVLKEKILLFSKELFDPNFRKRKTSIQQAINLC